MYPFHCIKLCQLHVHIIKQDVCPFINYSVIITVCQVYVKNIFHYYNNSNIFYRNFRKCILSCLTQMTTDMFRLSNHNPVPSLFMTYHFCNKSNTTGVTCGATLATLVTTWFTLADRR
jgi:hypothetical protein